MPDAAVATASPLGGTPPLQPDASAFEDWLKKTYTPSLEKSGAGAQAAYKTAGEKLAGLEADEQKLQPPAPPAATPPPQTKDTPVYEQFGSLAMAVATIGSALTRQPMINALNSGAQVMNAFHQADADTAATALSNWHAQTDYTIKLHDYQNELYKESLEKLRAGEQGALDELKIELGATGDNAALQTLELRGQEGLVRLLQSRDNAFAKLQQNAPKALLQGMQATEMLRWQKQWGIDDTHPPTPEAYADLKTRLAQIPDPTKKAGSGSTLEASKTLEILDDKGKVIRTVLAREAKDKAGWVDSQSGDPIQLQAGQSLKEITPSAAGGGRSGAQVLRQQIGGREVLSDLQNVVNLPVGTTIGPTGTVQTGPTITEALKGDLVRELTSQDAQLMQASLASMTRELSVLMSPVYGGNYASAQIEPLIPKSGDTVGTAIFKIARLAQSADNALEGLEKSPILSNDQQEYASDMRKQISEAVPWTSAQAMAFARQGDTSETFGDFVKRNQISGVGGSQRPRWATGSATGKGGEKIYTDGTGWFHADHTPVK